MLSIRQKKTHFQPISGSTSIIYDTFRILFGHNTPHTYTIIGKYHYPMLKVPICANGPSKVVHQAKKAHFQPISGCTSIPYDPFRILLGHNTPHKYTIIGKYHYPMLKVPLCDNGPSNVVHQAKKSPFSAYKWLYKHNL